MKAVVITRPGGPEVLQIVERSVPAPARNDVLIEVKAAGINRPDTFQRKGNYPAPPGAPADIPGLEVSGVIVQCGAGVARWKPGDRVCALLAGGGYAEFAAVSQDHCLPIPNGWNFTQAASLPETVFTVWHNVFERGRLSTGEHLLIHGGSSGIGITAIQLAKGFGAKVSVTAGSAEKCDACRRLGADRAINYNTEDFDEVLKAEGVDLILDMVGGDYTARNLKVLRDDGRLVFINAMQGGNGAFNALDVMRRRLTITGSTLRSRNAEFKAALATAVLQNVWPLIESGKFKPVIFKTFPLERSAEAHALLESSAHIGKIVLEIGR